MSRFNQVGDPTKNGTLAALYQDMLENGFGDEAPINWLTSQSSRPDILAGTWEFSKGMLLQGELPMMVKQMIAATIAARNDCNYCQELHGNTLIMLGVSKALVSSCVSDPELTEVPQPHRAILQFAIKVSRNPGKVNTEDIKEMQARGLTKSEILEVMALSAYCNFINTWADISRIRIEKEGECDEG